MSGHKYFVYKQPFVIRLLISLSTKTEINLFRIPRFSQIYDLCVSEETISYE
jgi:hypothetical protein